MIIYDDGEDHDHDREDNSIYEMMLQPIIMMVMTIIIIVIITVKHNML